MDEIIFSFPDIDTAIRAIDALQSRASELKAQKPSLSVSRGEGAEGLAGLAASVSAFAGALEKEMIEGKAWLGAASDGFGSADGLLADGFSGR